MTSTSSSSSSTTPRIRDFDEIIDSLDISVRENVFDLIVIDIDGNDYHVFDSMMKYRAKCMMVEFNPTIPNKFGLCFALCPFG